MLRNLTLRGRTPFGTVVVRRGRPRRGMPAWSAGALIALVVFLVLVLKPAGTTQRAAAGPVVGSRVADFTLPDLTGRSRSLHQYLGRPLFLQFWAVDCPSCAHERPALLRAAAPFLTAGGLAVGVDSYMESAAVVRSYLTDHREPYTEILIDTNGRVVYGKFHVIGVPTSLFIDRKGVVRKIVTGEMTESEMRAAFAQVST